MQENITSIATRRGRHAESASGQLSSGQGGFCSYFERELNRLLENNRASFYVWIETMGYHLPPITSDYERSFDVVTMALIDEFERVGDVRWRHVSSFLYTEELLSSIGDKVLEFLQLADRAVKENKMSKLRLIVPSGRNLWELCADALQPECSYEENPGVFDMHGDPASLGESTLFQRDSDQFPAESVLQNIGEKLRAFPRWLRSRESAFGFRVACATMTVAIVAFLQDTQEFFIRQRLIWAIIVINLSMSPTVGQSLSNFVLRVVGTAAAVALTILIWYIGGQTAAGTITVLFFFFIFKSNFRSTA
jgi:hypothetical protein